MFKFHIITSSVEHKTNVEGSVYPPGAGWSHVSPTYILRAGNIRVDWKICNWPAFPDDPHGIRWPLFLNSLFVCLFVCLSVLGKFSNFFLQYKAAAVRAVIGPLTPTIHGDKSGLRF